MLSRIYKRSISNILSGTKGSLKTAITKKEKNVDCDYYDNMSNGLIYYSGSIVQENSLEDLSAKNLNKEYLKDLKKDREMDLHENDYYHELSIMHAINN